MSTPFEGRVLVTGAAGMLGSELLLTAPDGVHPIGTDLRAAPDGNPAVEIVGVDLTSAREVDELVASLLPLAGILHPAAYTAVDRAEEESELAHRVNAVAAGNLARAAARHGIPMVLVSTDFVFDGTAREPYRPEDPVAPLGVYGRTKYEGEERCRAEHPEGLAVVRTQWLYGPRGQHFPGTILRLAEERDELRVVSDQVGSPTSTLELAPALWDVLVLGGRGTYHAACEGEASWYDFAAAAVELAGRKTTVHPCTTEEFPRPAPRPAYSVLDSSRLAALRGKPLAPWREALATFLNRP
ncbi:MAG TPA: dTDP-4-dehydrorhamnose reductase [Planctomycetes bacterium]|nr:dTDP-4-dehydrorhamnose reductase [Planctomycetota bacterium]